MFFKYVNHVTVWINKNNIEGVIENMYELTIHKMGMDTTEVEILKWFVKPGDKIQKGDPIVEIEFEKATTEIASEVSGVIEEILFQEGDMVDVGSVIARIQNS